VPVKEVSADVTTFVPGRRVDDNVHVLLRYENGARGMLWASQVSPGNENALRIRIFGEKAGLEWSQEHPNQLRFAKLGERPQILNRGTGGLTAAAGRPTPRPPVPPGHPEGYLEAFANLYADLAEQIEAKRDNRKPDPLALSVPSVEDGARGVKFILAALESSAQGGTWVDATVTL